MPILDTAKRHFDEDVARADGLRAHASAMAAGTLRDDVLRAALMMAVGAMDAFFCDAFADLIARSLQAKEIEPSVPISTRLQNLKVPVVAVIRPSTSGWRWRMAARELMEKENVLSLESVRSLFNQFARDNHKLMNRDTIDSWVTNPKSNARLFGITRSAYASTASTKKAEAKKDALQHFEERFKTIIQRRHDCIHSCDRPKVAPQPISHGSARNVIGDVAFLVQQCVDALRTEFPHYLSSWFESLDHAREMTAAWRAEYNAHRPHRALGHLAPDEYARRRSAPASEAAISSKQRPGFRYTVICRNFASPAGLGIGVRVSIALTSPPT